MTPTSHTLSSGELTLAAEVFEPARETEVPLLMVMGLGAQMLLWPDGFCEKLADHGHRVIRYDNRDVGLSSRLDQHGTHDILKMYARQKLGRPIPPAYTLSDMARDAVAVLDHFGIERACAVGASMGGMIVQRLGLEHPERLTSLVSMMSTARPAFPALSTVPLLLTRPKPGREAAMAHSVRWFETIGSKSLPFDMNAIAEMSGRCFDRGPSPQGFARHLHAIVADGDRGPALSSLKVPALVIHGDEDTLVPLKLGIESATAMGARAVVLRGMGHDFPLSLWDRLVDEIHTHAA